jgi:hypothetical protein
MIGEGISAPVLQHAQLMHQEHMHGDHILYYQNCRTKYYNHIDLFNWFYHSDILPDLIV